MDDNVNYKDGSSFAKAMKGKQNEAQSQFAKNKTKNKTKKTKKKQQKNNKNKKKQKKIIYLIPRTSSSFSSFLFSHVHLSIPHYLSSHSVQNHLLNL